MIRRDAKFVVPLSPLVRAHARGLTLLELVVAVAVLAIVAALLLHALSTGRQSANRASCVSNLRQISTALGSYAGDHDGELPFGPKAPPFTSPSQLYPSTGAPTSLISLRDGRPVALGLLLRPYLENNPSALFCPGADSPLDVKAELEKVGTAQAQCSYYYRHAGNTLLFDSPYNKSPPVAPRISNLGLNRRGKQIRALVMDTLFLCPPDLDQFQVRSRSHHGGEYVNVLFADGHVVSATNTGGILTVDVRDYGELRESFDRILRAFENADDLL